LTKRLWRMLPIALVIVLAAASAVFATNEPYDLKITKIGGLAVGADGTLAKPVYTTGNADITVEFEFCWTAAGTQTARVELVDGTGKAVGTATEIPAAAAGGGKYTNDDPSTFKVTTPTTVLDKTKYTVRLVVTTESAGQTCTVDTSVANAVEIDIYAPPIAGITMDPASPMNNDKPVFTWPIPEDDRAGVPATIAYQYLFTNTPAATGTWADPGTPPTTLLGGDPTKHVWVTENALGDAAQWYFHLHYEDKLGNISVPGTFGPFIMDKNAPTLALKTTLTNEKRPTIVIEATEPGLAVSGIDTGTGTFVLRKGATEYPGTGGWSTKEGKWYYSWTPSADLPSAGTYKVFFTGVEDLAGNSAAADISDADLIVDWTAPVFSDWTPGDGTLVGATTTIQVKVSETIDHDLTKMLMWVNDKPITSGLDYNDGTKTITYTAGAGKLPEGLIRVVVNVEDLAGNKAATNWQFFHDSIAPVAEMTAPSEYATVRRPTITIAVTEDGSGLDLSGVTVTFNGAPVTSACSWTGNVCTYTPPTDLTEDATYSVAMTGIEDKAGNAAVYKDIPWTFTVDTVKPTIESEGPTGWITTALPKPTIGATLADPLVGSGIDEKTITMTINGVAVPKKVAGPPVVNGWEYAAGALTYGPTDGLRDGNYEVVVSVKDKAGNEGSKTWKFGVDSVAPKLGSAVPKGWTNSLTPDVVLSVIEETSGLDLYDAGPPKTNKFKFMLWDGYAYVETNGEGSWDAPGLTYTWRLKEGKQLHEDLIYTAKMKAANATDEIADKAGNSAEADEFVWSFRIDMKPPVITPQDYLDFHDTSKPEIRAIVGDEGLSGVDPASIEMTVDGTKVSHVFTFATQKVSYVPADDLMDGEHVIALDLKDFAGNAAHAEWKIKIDTTAPSVPTGLGVGNVADSGTWYINALSSAFRWNTSEDPDAPDGTPGSGLCCYDWEFGLKETLPEEGEDWVDALIDSYRTATPGADVEQLTIPFGLFGGLPAGVEYAFRVRANDDLHNGSDWSEPITFVYDPNPPTAVTNLMGDPNPENPYPNFSWTAATDAISGVAGYVIRIKTKGSASWDAFDKFVDFPDGATGTLAWQLKVKLDPGQYTMSIAAQDVAGNIGPAEQINFSVEAPSIVPVISVLKPTEGSYNINEISTVKFQVVDCYDEEIEVAVEGATLSHIVTIVDTPTLTQFYLLLDPQPGDLKITITVGEVTETFSYTVEAERSGFGFGRLRPW